MSTSSDKTAGLIGHHHSVVLQEASLDISGYANITPSTVLFCLWRIECFKALIAHLILNTHGDDRSVIDEMTARLAIPCSLA